MVGSYSSIGAVSVVLAGASWVVDDWAFSKYEVAGRVSLCCLMSGEGRSTSLVCSEVFILIVIAGDDG